MNEAIYRQSLKFGAWSGVLFLVLFGIGWAGVAGWFPPPAPTLGAEEIAELYGANHLRIRFGLLIMMLGTLFFVPFTGALCLLVSKIEGRLAFSRFARCVADSRRQFSSSIRRNGGTQRSSGPNARPSSSI